MWPPKRGDTGPGTCASVGGRRAARARAAMPPPTTTTSTSAGGAAAMAAGAVQALHSTCATVLCTIRLALQRR